MTRRRAPAVDHSGSVYATGYGVVSRGLGWVAAIVFPWTLIVLTYLHPWLLIPEIVVAYLIYRLLRR